MRKIQTKEIPFKDFVTLQRGFDLPKSQMRNGAVPVLGSNSIIGFHDEAKVKTPGVVTGRSGTLGLVQYSEKPFWPHNTALWVKDFKGNHPRFVYYKLQTMHLENFNGGVSVPTLNRNVLNTLPVNVPALDEQNRIADTLSAYDKLIEINQRRIKLLEKSARLIYKEWFVHLRFPGHERVKIKNGVPDGWKICSMLEHPHFEYIRENIRPFDDTKRYYATADISGITINGAGINYTHEEKPSRAQKAPEIGSVWFARMQDTYKVLIFTNANRDLAEGSILSSGFAGFRARRPDFLPYLYFLINNTRFHEEKNRFCTGATQRSLPDNGLKNIRALAPAADITGKFAGETGAMIEQILTLQGMNKKLARVRDLLLPKLMVE